MFKPENLKKWILQDREKNHSQIDEEPQIEFSQAVQRHMDASGKELTAEDLWKLFESEYRLDGVGKIDYSLAESGDGDSRRVGLRATTEIDGTLVSFEGKGSGPIEAFVTGLNACTDHVIRVLDYHQHAIGSGADARSAAFVEVQVDGQVSIFGAGIDPNIVTASLAAVVSALHRSGVSKEMRAQVALLHGSR